MRMRRARRPRSSGLQAGGAGLPPRSGLFRRAKAKAPPTSPSLRPADTRHHGNVAMGLAANIVFEADVIAQSVDEARLPIAGVMLRIVNGNEVLKLGRADAADALHRRHLVGMGRAGGVEEGLFV